MAIENGVQNAELGYILDPAFQIENLNGKPVVGGYICIYEAGTDNKYISYENFDGAQNPFKIPLRADGRAVILGDPSLTYDIYFYDSYGNQLFSRLNVQCNVPGNISIKGADTRIKNTDGTLDISLQTMGNNVREYTVNTRNKLLDVQAPLYFVENSQSATIIGIKGGASGYVTKDYVDSAVSGKLDTTAFSTVSGDFLTDKFEYDDNFNITGYDGSAFASNGETYSAGTNIDITDNVISVTGLPTSSDVENAISSAVTNVENKFEYNENNYITAYNNSAFAGTNYSAGDYVSIENDTISVTGLQPSGDYATHDDLTAYQPSGDYATKTELESATSGKMDVTGMTAYQPTGDYATHDDLTAYQPVGDYYSASNPSGFITNDAITGLQPSGDYVTHDEMTGYQPVGDYYSASNPSGFITNDAITGLQPSGDYATHDDLTAYATTALVSSVSSELYSAVSSISGDFELVAGSGVELVDDPNEKTTTINVTAEGTPVTAIEQMIESATSGKADTSHVIEYRYTPDSDPIYASFGSLVNVNRIYGSALDINSGVLWVSGIVNAAAGSFEAAGLNAGNGGSFHIKCAPEVFSGGNLTGFTFLSQNTSLGTAKLTTADGNAIVQMSSPKFEAKNISGAGFSIEGSGAKGYDHNGNVVWDTNKPAKLIGWSNYQGTAIDPRAAGINGGIIATVYPDQIPTAMTISSAPYAYMNGYGVFCCYPNGTQLSLDTSTSSISLVASATSASASMTPSDVSYNKYNSATSATDVWSLTGSVQKREIECDADTSAITSIAGSAIGGGVSQSAFDELKQSYDALSALFATYSGQWLLPNEGEE